MPDNNTPPERHLHFILVTLLTLCVFFLLFVFRSVDDNRLTSWQWAFAHVNPAWFIPLILTGILIVYALLRFPFAGRNPALFLFVSSFAASAVFWRSPETIVDVSRYFTQAKHLEIYGVGYFLSEWGRTINAWTDLPLVPFLYGVIFRVFGEARVYIQIFTGLLFAGTTVVTYLTGQRLWDKHTGFFAGLMLLGIPYIFSQTPLMLVDVPTMFFLSLSVYAFIRALDTGGLWIAASSAAVSCAVFSKYSTWMMLSVLAVVFFVCLRRRTGEAARDCIVRAVVAVLLAAVLAGIPALLKFDVIRDQIRFLREYQMPGLKRWGESFASTFLFQVHPFITAAGLYSVYAALKKRDGAFLVAGWLVFLVVLLQIRRSRYVLVVFPMLTLMASFGLQAIRDMELRKYIVSCIVASSLVTAVFAYLPLLQEMAPVNLKNAGRFLNSTDVEGAVVFTIPSEGAAVNQAVSVPVLDLFTDKKIYYDYDPALSPPPEKVETSPLRFTWEYRNPRYYYTGNDSSGRNAAVAVISNGIPRSLPGYVERRIKGRRKAGVFSVSTGLFSYRPVVTVYLPGE
ncbi:MAG: glycosyltransferase family 39 protein [Deferribacteres bacterium]|nr:glycosyltransferase family 39 protein [Deferribacteres bacterium]